MTTIIDKMQWDKAAVPLVKGVNTSVRARLADPANLVIADNVFFPVAGGPEKRAGYSYTKIEDKNKITSSLSDYTYGLGVGGTDTLSPAGPIRSICKLGSEAVSLAGDSLYNSERLVGKFDCFSAETRIIAKTQGSQFYSDMGKSAINKVVAYVNPNINSVEIAVYSSTTNELKFRAISTVPNPQYVTVVPVGEYIHIYINDITSSKLYLHVVFPSDLTLRSPVDLGSCKSNFDVYKVDESLILIAKRTVSDTIVAGYVKATGVTDSTYAAFNTVINIGADTVTGFACCVHPDQTVGFIWDAGANQKARTYSKTLAVLGAIQTVTSLATNIKQTLTYNSRVAGEFYFYVDDSSKVNSGKFGAASSSVTATSHNTHLVGKAFCIGVSPFVWLCRSSKIQTSYLICNSSLLPVGRLEYGTAVANTADQRLFSSHTDGNTVHGAFNFNRNASSLSGIFHESSTKEYVLDFSFKPRGVQVGGAVYYPGAQVTQYDGENISEAGFHFFIEDPSIVASTAAGSLTLLGTYFYLIYPCHKNAAGEEVRGPAVFTSGTTLAGANNTITITGKTIPTLRPDSYFLVFRNANTGTNYHLVSDRNIASASCPKNDQSVATWTFTDTLSDTDLISRELDNATTDNYLVPFSAPSCTILSFGKDRLWAAGGEIPDYRVCYGRLSDEFEAPSFHPALTIEIDKSLDKVTAIGFISDYVVIFKRSLAYILTGQGLDNVLTGSLFNIQTALTDVGSVGAALRNITAGLVFKSDGGYRLFQPGGSVVDISNPVLDYLGEFLGSYVDIINTSLIIYQDNCTLCWNYESNLWSRWTIGSEAASDCEFLGSGNYIARQGNGYLDRDSAYDVRIKTSPFSNSLGDFQRIRRVAGVGLGEGTFKINIYLDEKENPSDTFDISTPENDSNWGDGTWGSGFWGDSGSTYLSARDDRMRWVKRLSKQKCSCIAVEIVYTGKEKGPIHTALVFEYGTKNGIDRSH